MKHELYKQSSNLTFGSTTYAHANTLQVSKLCIYNQKSLAQVLSGALSQMQCQQNNMHLLMARKWLRTVRRQTGL
jgi:hypothetical protein